MLAARVPRYFSFLFPFLAGIADSDVISKRNAWLPYFDQVNAIIFLAPISCFDERLQEDPRVNRLEDSFILWKAVCSSKLLSKTTLIIFLNKVDILSQKIENGVMVNRYLPSYGNRPNDTQSVVKCTCAISHLHKFSLRFALMAVPIFRPSPEIQGYRQTQLSRTTDMSYLFHVGYR